MRLNLGCGRDIKDGWVNVDQHPAEGVGLVADLDQPDKVDLPWPDDTFTDVYVSHLVEHLHYPLPLFAEAWRVAEPDAELVVRCPYGSSDAADEDPTHVRRLFLNSWGFFSQPFYWRADYGYRGDWQPETITLKIADPFLKDLADDELKMLVRHSRNVVAEMVVTLRAIKPARAPERDLQTPPQVIFARV
jgi:SAM-dependent methyltransferase